jgi:hypothetical protein
METPYCPKRSYSATPAAQRHIPECTIACIKYANYIEAPVLLLFGSSPDSWLPRLTGLSWPNIWVGKYENRPYWWMLIDINFSLIRMFVIYLVLSVN